MAKNGLMVRLSDKERLIVQYIVNQLESAYRNTSGKPVYARNMDQVMKDIFGIKKFTKTLAKAKMNEGMMIQLMKTLDTETLWRITRSKEHFGLLCALVALDHKIVKMGKNYNKMLEMEPAQRPVRKMRKLAKQIKKGHKMYRTCVKTFRDIFDIEKVSKSAGANGLMDVLSNWLDRHDQDDDIFSFGDYDYEYSAEAIDSMDAYVNQRMKKKSTRRPVREGALDIFSDHDDVFDDEDDDEPYGYDDDDDDGPSDMDRLADAIARKMGMSAPPPTGPAPNSGLVDPNILAILNTIKDGFEKLSGDMEDIYDLLSDDGEDAPEEENFMGNAPRAGRPTPSHTEMSVDELVAAENPEEPDPKQDSQ